MATEPEHDPQIPAAEAPLVLLVDDDPDIRRVLTLLLGHGGLNVMEAADGLEALDRAQERTPDVIVADVQMPNLDGLEMARRLHKHEPTANTPVLLFSGKPPHPGLNDVLRFEHVRFISKGDPQKVIDAVHQMIGDTAPAPR